MTITADDVRAITKEARANLDRLDACPGHEFPPLQAKLGARYECKHCKGVLSAGDRHWYERGVEHGRAQTAKERG